MLFENVSGRPDDAAPDAVSAAIPTRSFSSDSEKGPTTFSEAWRLAERAIRARVARACREHPRYCTVDDREELIQQARVVVWECLKTYRPTESKFATYAGAAIENMLCDFFARRRREAELVVDPSRATPMR
jgi:DNA-directed RNA polymerase specialized sigma24 family protein